MAGMLDEWIRKRQEANERVLTKGTLTTKRFFALDGQAYEDGGVDPKAIVESLDVALVVGGSISIPHVRHAQLVLQEIEEAGGLPAGW